MLKLIWGLISIILILYIISWSRDLIKAFLLTFLGTNSLLQIQKIFHFLQPLFQISWKIISLFLIIIYLGKCVNLLLNRKKIKKNDNRDDLYKSLFQYITSDDTRCFLLFGSWGVGKSYHIQNFISDMKQSKLRSIYRVSCFGISTREALLKELQSICEAEDKSIKKFLIELIRNIPIIGELCYKLLKSNYELRNIKKRSIFIFDDFERIVACDIPTIESSNRYYRPSTSLGNKFNSTNYENDIIQEFNNIATAFNNVEKHEAAIIEYYILDKFNMITGLINELLEYYHMHVIVVANIDKIPIEYFQNTFEQKMTCIKFHLTSSNYITRKLFNDQIELYASLTAEKKQFLKSFFDQNSDDINKVWEQTSIENMRILICIINAYIATVEQYELSFIEGINVSLFYSIFTSFVFYEQNIFDILKRISIGENLIAFWKKNNINNNMEQNVRLFVESSTNGPNLRWCGIAISCQWILGYHNIINIKSLVNQISSYKSEFETTWIKSGRGDNPRKIDDWLIFIKENYPSNVNQALNLVQEDKIDFHNFSKAFLYSLRDQQLLRQALFSILDKLGFVEVFKDNPNLESVVFQKIDQICPNIDSQQIYGDIANTYRDWIKTKGIPNT